MDPYGTTTQEQAADLIIRPDINRNPYRPPLGVIGAKQSMSGMGNCYENATMEAFFSTLKTEYFPENQLFCSQTQARREIFEYIELYYNNQRLSASRFRK